MVLNTENATFESDEFDGDADGDGGHLVVLEDYVVHHPELGVLQEGDLSEELKQKALEGQLLYVKAKNSWGTDRPERGLTDGYTRFDIDYLTETTVALKGFDYTGFVMPVGYYQ